MLNLDEYKKRNAEKPAKVVDLDQRRNLRQIHREGVAASLLTGHQHWDTYLTYLQGAIKQTEDQRTGFLEALSDPMIVDENQVARLRMAVVACNERIGAWKAAMALPKDLMEQGDKAKLILKDLPEIEAKK